MTDTEDPNIATLRELLACMAEEERSGVWRSGWKMLRRRAPLALDALASTLADRDRRIAELEGRQFPKAPTDAPELAHAVNVVLEFSGRRSLSEVPGSIWQALLHAAQKDLARARPAPAPGELAKATQYLRDLLSGELAGHEWALTRTISAAESWQRLQWRPASEAPTKWCRALVRGPLYGDRFAVCTFDPALGWMSGTDYTKVTHYILEDDLRAALNGGDDNG